jgi:hypothetical protein
MANTTFSSGELVTAAKLNTLNPSIISAGGSEARTLATRAADVVNVLDFDAKGDGVIDDKDAIQAGVTAASNNVLYFPAGTYLINSDITLPSSISVRFEPGAELSVAAAATVTVNCFVEAPATQIFSGAGAVVGSPSFNDAYAEWFGAAGDYVPADPGGLSGAGTDDSQAFLKVFAFAGSCTLQAKNYKWHSTSVVPVLTKSLMLKGPIAGGWAAVDGAIIYNTNDYFLFYAGVGLVDDAVDVNSVTLENFTLIAKKNGIATKALSFDNSLGKTYFRMFNVQLYAPIAKDASDANKNTNKVIDSTGAAESAVTITDFSPQKTFEDVKDIYGVGIQLVGTLDATVTSCVVRGFGVGLANVGSDVTNVDHNRFADCGIHVYDKWLGTDEGSMGRLVKIKNNEMLYTYRQPSLLFDNSKYIEVDHHYYEQTLSGGLPALVVAAQGAQFKLTDIEFDNVWSNLSDTTPIMLLDNLQEGCIIRDNFYAQYRPLTPTVSAPIRCINFGRGVLHRRGRIQYGPNKSSIFPELDFSNSSNDDYVTGIYEHNKFNPHFITPQNFVGRGVEITPDLDTDRLVFRQTGLTGQLVRATALLPKLKGTLNINITGKAAGGRLTDIFFTITLKNQCGEVSHLIRNDFIAGFNTSTYATVVYTFNLDTIVGENFNTVEFLWTQNLGDVSAIYLS